MPRPRKDSEGNVVPSTPKTPEQILDSLASRISQVAMLNKINQDTVTNLIVQKFSSEQDNVRREQLKQLTAKLTPEQIEMLLEQAGIAKAS